MTINSEKLDYRGLVGQFENLELAGTELTVTAAQINAQVLPANTAEIVITTNAITAAETGKTFFLDLAGGFTSTLPAVALGLKYTFVVKTAPTTAYVVTAGSAIIIGGVNELEVDTADDGPYTTGATNLNFVANIAAVGDFAVFECDGVKWFVRGQTNLDGGVTFT